MPRGRMSVEKARRILGISQEADETDIKGAYWMVDLFYNPDRNPASKFSEQEFKVITEAYDMLLSRAKEKSHPFLKAEEELKEDKDGSAYERWWKETFFDFVSKEET